MAVRSFSPALLLLASCAGAAGSSRIEDKARRDVPIAICRKTLATDDLSDTGAVRPEAYWKVLVPSFRGFDAPLDATAADCAGNATFAPTETHGAPVRVSAADMTLASSKDGFQGVWLHGTAADRMSAGPLAVVRLRSSELDVYAIGLYRGSAHQSRLNFGRIGPRMLVAAKDDACADVKVGAECGNTLSFYIVDGGQLVLAAETPTDRLQYGTMKDVGRIQFRLTTDPPVWDATSVHIHERLSVRDSGDDEIRKSEGERVFTLHDDKLVANKDSIWQEPNAGRP